METSLELGNEGNFCLGSESLFEDGRLRAYIFFVFSRYGELSLDEISFENVINFRDMVNFLHVKRK